MIPSWNGSSDIAVTSEKLNKSNSLSELRVVFRRVIFRGGYQKENVVQV